MYGCFGSIPGIESPAHQQPLLWIIEKLKPWNSAFLYGCRFISKSFYMFTKFATPPLPSDGNKKILQATDTLDASRYVIRVSAASSHRPRRRDWNWAIGGQKSPQPDTPSAPENDPECPSLKKFQGRQATPIRFPGAAERETPSRFPKSADFCEFFGSRSVSNMVRSGEKTLQELSLWKQVEHIHELFSFDQAGDFRYRFRFR